MKKTQLFIIFISLIFILSSCATDSSDDSTNDPSSTSKTITGNVSVTSNVKIGIFSTNFAGGIFGDSDENVVDTTSFASSYSPLVIALLTDQEIILSPCLKIPQMFLI